MMMMLREGNVTLPRLPKSNYKLGPGGSSRLLKSNICERCEGWGLFLRQVKSAYLSQSFPFTKSHSIKYLWPRFPSFLCTRFKIFMKGWMSNIIGEKQYNLDKVQISRLSCGIFRDTRNALLFMHPEICPGVSWNGRWTTFGEPVPASNQCLYCSWYLSVRFSTMGYFRVLLRTQRYMPVYVDSWWYLRMKHF